MTTIAEVKANSEIYNAIKTEILADEKDRIESFSAWSEVDPKEVLAKIVSGEKYTQSFGAKMQVKAMSAEGIKNITAANAKDVKTDPVDESVAKTAEELEGEKLRANVSKNVLARFGVTA